jgi:hypothetical protein
MRILKLLNKKILSLIIIFLLSSFDSIAEEQPIDIWNIDKKEIEITPETPILDKKIEVSSESSIYNMQVVQKKKYHKTRSRACLQRN